MGESPAEKASFLPLQKLALNSHIPENLSRYSCVFHVMPCVCILFPQIEESTFYGTKCNLYFSVLPSSPPTSNTFISLCPPGLNCASFPPHTMLFLAPVALLLSLVTPSDWKSLPNFGQFLVIHQNSA